MRIDFHAHVLPRADHGCTHSTMSHHQLMLMKRAGTDAVVATPHFYPNHDSVESFLERREGSLSAIIRKLPLEELPTVYVGAEVLVCVGMDEMPLLERLTVAGTKVILLEMPYTLWSDELIATVRGVSARGLTPVLAHIDRYPRGDVERLLAETDALAQVNADAFGLFKRTRWLRSYMEEGRVVALGSDLHGERPRDYKRFLKMQRKLGPLADAVFARTESLLEGATPLQEIPAPIAHT
jgi:protein-tyrosine phosphatase